MPVMRLIEKMACLHSEACFGFMVTLVYYHDCGCLECLKKICQGYYEGSEGMVNVGGKKKLFCVCVDAAVWVSGRSLLG